MEYSTLLCGDRFMQIAACCAEPTVWIEGFQTGIKLELNIKTLRNAN